MFYFSIRFTQWFIRPMVVLNFLAKKCNKIGQIVKFRYFCSQCLTFDFYYYYYSSIKCLFWLWKKKSKNVSLASKFWVKLNWLIWLSIHDFSFLIWMWMWMSLSVSVCVWIYFYFYNSLLSVNIFFLIAVKLWHIVRFFFVLFI